MLRISSQDSVQGHSSVGCFISHDSRVSSLSKLQQEISLLSLRHWQLATSLELFRKEVITISNMTTTFKINVDKASLKTLFKTVAKINDDLNEISLVHGTTRRRLQIKRKHKLQTFIRLIDLLIQLF